MFCLFSSLSSSFFLQQISLSTKRTRPCADQAPIQSFMFDHANWPLGSNISNPNLFWLRNMLMKTTIFKKTESHQAALEESGSSTSSQRQAQRLRYKRRIIGRVSSSHSASLMSTHAHWPNIGNKCAVSAEI